MRLSLLTASILASTAFAIPTHRPKHRAIASAIVSASASSSSSNSTGCTSYTVVESDTCIKVAKANSITLAEFLSANPAVNADCQNLIKGEVVCIPSLSTQGGAKAVAALAVSTGNLTVSKLGAVSSEGWKLAKLYEGDSFFDGMDFYGDYAGGGADPTHGQVYYVGKSDSSSLIGTSDTGSTLLKLEAGSNNWNRKSIRLQSQLQLDVGSVVILDANHVPTGEGVWPAFWTVGQNWPTNGEIDILEYVNNGQSSQTSFHTASGCWMDDVAYTGTLTGGPNCSSDETANGGCGVLKAGKSGKSFNDDKGGVYAMVMTGNGIKTFAFNRDNIPADITQRAPKPSTWGTPAAFLKSSKCDPAQFFKKHSIVINTTLCGDWAGNAYPGGMSACKAAAANMDVSQAYWDIASVQVYTQS